MNLIRNLAFFLAGLIVALAINGFTEPYAGISNGTEGKRQTTSFFVGYKYRGWFAEMVKPSFQDKRSNEFFRDDGSGAFGGGVTTTWEAMDVTTTATTSFNLGKLFPVYSVEIGPFIGAHRYHETSAGHSRLVKIDQATGDAIIDHTETHSSDRAGWAPAYGLTLVVPAAKHVAFIGRFTKYQVIDRRVLEFGLQVSL